MAMTFEEFEAATPAELRAEAKQRFDETRGQYFDARRTADHMLEAQLYMQEMDRREDTRIARRDFRMELVVIALIGLELIAAIGGIWLSIREGNEQAKAMERTAVILERVEKAAKQAAKNAIVGPMVR